IRARAQRVMAWLQLRRPDVLCMQEIKIEEVEFPSLELKALGYDVMVEGQRTYNGVAIASRLPMREVRRGLGGGGADAQARLLWGSGGGGGLASGDAPNGQTVGSDKWRYKLRWLERLRRHLEQTGDPQQPLALCGDWNVAPEARDVHDPVRWEKAVLFHPDARAALARVCAWGLRDAYRLHHEEAGRYTWWDYRQLAFPKNLGLRIDHILVTAPLASRCQAVAIDREARKGKQPSDHAPVEATFEP